LARHRAQVGRVRVSVVRSGTGAKLWSRQHAKISPTGPRTSRSRLLPSCPPA
jgi:hypothetical protein